ncbi:helix-turn-helix domain-containing protein [Polyangium aurulentum]|uniref:helix-turn-helix domain-containing protein n=1 Tax=Polyangium aurulentum TaxID=2567896 RepID=UPI0010AEC95A|nr:helix-turn-helix transcriptional regulator [Polyangium aurulentum]UQA61425.1 helix-turn-helix domain-containing protein [Polyangium aurulentum]
MPRRATPDPLAIKLGARIRDLRLEKNMSLDQLSAASGVTKGHLSSVEHGRTVINVGTADKIARGLGMKLNTLFRFPSESPRRTRDAHRG